MDSNLRKGTPRPAGQGTSKGARRRRRQKSVPVVVVKQQPRRSARQRLARPRTMSAFVSCALDPFNHSGPLTGVPDRFSGLSVVIENRSIISLEVLKYTYIVIMPNFGDNLIYYTGEDDIASLKTKASSWKASDPIIDSSSFATWFGRARTISLSAKLLYTGAAVNVSGTIRVSRIPLEISSDSRWLYTGATVQNHVRQLSDIDLTPLGLMSDPASTMLPASRGVYATSVRTGGDSWDFVDLPNETTALTLQDLQKHTDGKATPITYWADTDFSAYDSNFNAIVISIAGATSSQYFGKPSYTLEVRHCVEAIPADNSTARVYRTLARQSPAHQPEALDAVSNAQRVMPAAIAADESWLSKFAGSLGHATGRFFGRAAGALVSSVAEPIVGAFSALGIGAPQTTRSNRLAITY